MRAPLLLRLVLMLAAGCVDPPVVECGDGCGDGRYCCLGACRDLGTTCGAADVGPFDAGAHGEDAFTPRDASPRDDASSAPTDPCTPRGGALSVVSACTPGPTQHVCATGATASCAGGTPSCIEWIDADGAMHGVCAADRRRADDVCDPARDRARCDGPVPRVCVAKSSGSSEAPPGWWEGDDPCHLWWSDDATCAVFPDGWARCTSPTDVPCDPVVSTSGCDDYCMAVAGYPMGGVVRPRCGGARPLCVRDATGRSRCLPADAVPSTRPVTSTPIGVACDGATSIRIAEVGYEYVQECEPTVVPGGPFVATRCWMSPDGSYADCVTDDTVICATQTSEPSCRDETHSVRCVDWREQLTQCRSSICDASTGSCAWRPPCSPSLPFIETCAGPNHKWVAVDGCAAGSAMAAPCPGCAETDRGVTCL